MFEFFGVLPADVFTVFADTFITREPASTPEVIGIAFLKVAPRYPGKGLQQFHLIGAVLDHMPQAF